MIDTNWFRALALLVAVTLVGCGGGEKPTPKGGQEKDKTADKAGADKGKAADKGKESDKDKGSDKGDADKDGGTKDGGEKDKGEPKPMPEPMDDPEPADPKPGDEDPKTTENTTPVETKVTGDWTTWGGTIGRNMVNATIGVTHDFNVEWTETWRENGERMVVEHPTRRLLWMMDAGSQAYANPVVADGRVFIGANNGSAYRPKYDSETDLGCVLAFDEKTGKFLWQLSRTKLAAGRVNDWLEQGICSTPFVEGDRLFVVTNRCEIMCLDTAGFYDGENDGFQDEEDKEEQDADIVWSLDMIEELGVFPHNLATSCPVVWGDHVFLITSNGVGEEHLEVPAPRAPSFIAVNKTTGELVWEDNTPFDGILHGQWSSPAVAEVEGGAQILMAGGDGWLYSFDPAGDGEGGGKILWKFDLNPKDTNWLLGGEGTRNAVISTPIVVDDSVVLAVGQDPEHGNGVGHIYRIALDKTGDVSPVLVVNKESGEPVEQGVLYDGGEEHEIKPNENSAQIWHFGGVDEDGSVTGREGGTKFGRTISTAAVSDGLVFAPDLIGYLHCLDFETGEQYWVYDTFGEVWGSPMVVDGKVFLGDAEGDLTVFAADKGTTDEDGKRVANVLIKKRSGKDGAIVFPNAIYSTPTIANGNMYMTDRNTLYAFDITPGNDGEATAAAAPEKPAGEAKPVGETQPVGEAKPAVEEPSTAE